MSDTLPAANAAGNGGARLSVERRDHVLVLTLDDTATRNALHSEGLFRSFEAVVAEANADFGVRAVVLTGAGLAFSSGGDVRDTHEKRGMFGGTPQQIAEQYRIGIQRIPRAMMELDVPAIAAVNGPAIGAGCDLACMCDLRIASERAVFAESFVKVGIIPGDGGSWLLPRIVGYPRAAQIACTGEMIDAPEALALGLVSRVVPHAELMDAALDLAPNRRQPAAGAALDQAPAQGVHAPAAGHYSHDRRIVPGPGAPNPGPRRSGGRADREARAGIPWALMADTLFRALGSEERQGGAVPPQRQRIKHRLAFPGKAT
jgi:2-(1,2-epoxy-1,2-dihydrophenyl)acetyl-CoA isomerase